MEYLTEKEILAVNRQVIRKAGEGVYGLQYPEGLSLVVEQPQMVVFGTELYPTIWVKAAYVMQKITKKHIFSDGNKRTAYIATKLFLMKNDYHLKVTKDEGIALMLGITTQDDTEEIMLKVAKFLKEHSSRIKEQDHH